MITRSQADLLLVIAAIIWGVAYYFQKSAMSHIGPLLFLGLRGAVAAIALAPLALRERAPIEAARGSVLPIAVLGGVLFFFAGAVQQTGIVTASVTNAGFLTALYIVTTPFVVWLLRRGAPAPYIWLAALLAFVGAWLLAGGSLAAFSTGDWLVSASAFIWAFHMIVTGDATKFMRPITFTCVQFAVVSALALSAAALSEPIALSSIIAAGGSILYVGLLSSALTFVMLAIALRRASPSHAAIIMSLDTIVAAIAGYVMLGERLPLVGWIGAALMLAAFFVVRLGPRRVDDQN